MNCLSFGGVCGFDLFHFGLHGAAECNFTPELLQQVLIVKRPPSRAKESVRRFGGEIEGIAPEGDHQIAVERPSQLRHTVHHRGGQYHTGLDLVVGVDFRTRDPPGGRTLRRSSDGCAGWTAQDSRPCFPGGRAAAGHSPGICVLCGSSRTFRGTSAWYFRRVTRRSAARASDRALRTDWLPSRAPAVR